MQRGCSAFRENPALQSHSVYFFHLLAVNCKPCFSCVFPCNTRSSHLNCTWRFMSISGRYAARAAMRLLKRNRPQLAPFSFFFKTHTKSPGDVPWRSGSSRSVSICSLCSKGENEAMQVKTKGYYSPVATNTHQQQRGRK